jgi:hypothetical protein
MRHDRVSTSTGRLWRVILLAVAYCVLLFVLRTLTGIRLLDGSVGVVLGLYICAQPAANAVDLLFFERGTLQRLSAEWAGLGWLGLNLLALAMGWLVITLGAATLARPVQ